MRSTAATRLLAAALFLGLTLPWAGATEPPRRKLPFQCFTEVWRGPFDVSGAAYNQAAQRVTWTLKVRKETAVGRYQALLTDGDGVEVATVEVKIDPKRPRYKAMSKLEASISLDRVDIDNVCKIQIRERR